MDFMRLIPGIDTQTPTPTRNGLPSTGVSSNCIVLAAHPRLGRAEGRCAASLGGVDLPACERAAQPKVRDLGLAVGGTSAFPLCAHPCRPPRRLGQQTAAAALSARPFCAGNFSVRVHGPLPPAPSALRSAAPLSSWLQGQPPPARWAGGATLWLAPWSMF